MIFLLTHFVLHGIASWFYPSSEYVGMRACAMNVVKPGSLVRIHDNYNGRTTSCRIIGSGPFHYGRVIDLSPEARDALRMGGTADVTVTLVRGKTKPCRTPWSYRC